MQTLDMVVTTLVWEKKHYHFYSHEVLFIHKYLKGHTLTGYSGDGCLLN